MMGFGGSKGRRRSYGTVRAAGVFVVGRSLPSLFCVVACGALFDQSRFVLFCFCC